jgi:hypothetical protein
MDTDLTSQHGTPIAIVGMHRSGTSMLARLLNLCGVYLGTPEELAFKDVHNPEGYWENPRFVSINERLLHRSGGEWDFPAPLQGSPELVDAERVRAAALVEELGGQRVWGWKDPRTSLTLPFWREVLPNLRAVVCVRHPIEVAWSLRQRNSSSSTFGSNLWLAYNRRILEAIPPSERVVTHYDAYFADPAAELRRVLSGLGLVATEEQVTRAAGTVQGDHRHHRFSQEQLAAASVTSEIWDVYQALCEEAGWDGGANAQRRGQRPGPPARTRTPWEAGAQSRLDVTPLELEAAHLANGALRRQVEEAQAQRAELSRALEACRAENGALQRQVEGVGVALAKVSAELEAAQVANGALDRRLEEQGARATREREAQERAAEGVRAELRGVAEELQVAVSRLASTEEEQDRTEEVLGQRMAQLAEAQRATQGLAAEVEAEREEWEQIRSGSGFPLLEGLWRWRARIAPHGSWRNEVLQAGRRIAWGRKPR